MKILLFMYLVTITNSLFLVYHDDCFQIKNKTLRETSTFSPSWFPTKHSVTVENNPNVIDVDKINPHKNYIFKGGLNNIIINSTNIITENILFNIDRDKTSIHIVGKFSAIPFIEKTDLILTSLNIKLLINNFVLKSSIFHKKFTFSYNKQILLDKGEYNLYFIVQTTNGIWCSCPETKKGYYMSRFLSKWNYIPKNKIANKQTIDMTMLSTSLLYSSISLIQNK